MFTDPFSAGDPRGHFGINPSSRPVVICFPSEPPLPLHPTQRRPWPHRVLSRGSIEQQAFAREKLLFLEFSPPRGKGFRACSCKSAVTGAKRASTRHCQSRTMKTPRFSAPVSLAGSSLDSSRAPGAWRLGPAVTAPFTSAAKEGADGGTGAPPRPTHFSCFRTDRDATRTRGAGAGSGGHVGGWSRARAYSHVTASARCRSAPTGARTFAPAHLEARGGGERAGAFPGSRRGGQLGARDR